MLDELPETAKTLESVVNATTAGVEPRQQRAKLEEAARLLLGGWTWVLMEHFGEAPEIVITGVNLFL